MQGTSGNVARSLRPFAMDTPGPWDHTSTSCSKSPQGQRDASTMLPTVPGVSRDTFGYDNTCFTKSGPNLNTSFTAMEHLAVSTMSNWAAQPSPAGMQQRHQRTAVDMPHLASGAPMRGSQEFHHRSVADAPDIAPQAFARFSAGEKCSFPPALRKSLGFEAGAADASDFTFAGSMRSLPQRVPTAGQLGRGVSLPSFPVASGEQQQQQQQQTQQQQQQHELRAHQKISQPEAQCDPGLHQLQQLLQLSSAAAATATSLLQQHQPSGGSDKPSWLQTPFQREMLSLQSAASQMEQHVRDLQNASSCRQQPTPFPPFGDLNSASFSKQPVPFQPFATSSAARAPVAVEPEPEQLPVSRPAQPLYEIQPPQRALERKKKPALGLASLSLGRPLGRGC
eukprot:TRINITY_DN6119_c1_g1_i1.p1 TRINITY_DN6119_c1_g1~~TRINITY_DN6119_c1_g1_i1.p1  ORF type:complete len:395 (+),score=67.58 TRINITY_DN6119_c1_g1_i1:88-1272(+)